MAQWWYDLFDGARARGKSHITSLSLSLSIRKMEAALISSVTAKKTEVIDFRLRDKMPGTLRVLLVFKCW